MLLAHNLVLHSIYVSNELKIILFPGGWILQGGIEVYEGEVILPQETDTAGIIYCLLSDAHHVSLVKMSPN